MASTDATPIAIKSQAYRVTFALLDADGDPVTGAVWNSGLASGAGKALVSKDGAASVNSTNNITEIDSGWYYLDITAAEMAFDTVALMMRTTTSGAKNTPILLNPSEDADIEVNVVNWNGSAPDNLSSGKLPADVKLWLTVAPAALSATGGYVQTMLMRWLTDNAAGTPNGLTSGRVDSIVGAVATGAIAAASFANGAFNAVWTVTTRVLTAGTNIALAKGTGVTGFNDLSAAQVNAEVLDVMNVDTFAEPGQGNPAAAATLAQKLGYLYKAWRNRTIQTTTEYQLYADDAVTKDQEADVSDSAGTYERGEMRTGA